MGYESKPITMLGSGLYKIAISTNFKFFGTICLHSFPKALFFGIIYQIFKIYIALLFHNFAILLHTIIIVILPSYNEPKKLFKAMIVSIVSKSTSLVPSKENETYPATSETLVGINRLCAHVKSTMIF